MSELAAAVSGKLKAAAKAVREELTELGEKASRFHHQIGYLIIKVRKNQLWSVEGFESEKAYCQDIDVVGKSTWFRTGRLFEELSPIIPKDTLMRISLENMEQLCRLPIKQRKMPSWWKRAIELKNAAFTELVDQAVPPEGESTTEDSDTRVWLKERMYAAQRDLILNVVKDFNKEHGIPLDDIGRGLEFICVEHANNNQSMIAAVRDVVLPKIRTVHELLTTSPKSADEVRIDASDLMGKAVEALAAVLLPAKGHAAAAD